MNSLILNRESFEMPADGWYQIAPVGEFVHSGAGVVQVVDRAACDAMVNTFRAEAQKQNFAGLLIDFDHFSLDEKLKSEAAGWVVDLEFRGGDELTTKNTENTKLVGSGADGLREWGTANGANLANANAGLWGKIRWSDLGEDCVKGGRYRFLSPVWSRSDCESVGSDPDSGQEKLRPVRLLNAAVTNDPNLKGMRPLSNRKTADDRPQTADRGETTTKDAKDTKREIANRDGDARLKWVLGEHDRNCPSCVELSGQVHTQADWDAAELRPGADKLYCRENCHCKLVETDDQARGSLADLPMRKEEVVNRKTEVGGQRSGDGVAKTEDVLLKNWSDAARAASIAVRRAKAAARKAKRDGGDKELAPEKGGKKARGRPEPGAPPDGDPLRRTLPVEPGDPEDKPLPVLDEDFEILPYDPEEDFERTLEALNGYRGDARSVFRQAFGYEPVDPEDVQAAEEMAGVPDEYRTGGVMSTRELAQKLTHYGEPTSERKDSDGGNTGHQALERKAQKETAREKTSRQRKTGDIHRMAEELMKREASGVGLTDDEKAFLKQYREIIGDLDDVRRDVAGNRGGGGDELAAREAVQVAKARARGFRGE